MNKELSFEVAKLLPVAFDTPKGYYKNGDTQLLLWRDAENWNNQADFICTAPTIADVVMWLCKNHGIYIWVSQELSDSRDFSWRFRNDVGATPPTGAYPEPSEAYEAAIEYVLTNKKI